MSHYVTDILFIYFCTMVFFGLLFLQKASNRKKSTIRAPVYLVKELFLCLYSELNLNKSYVIILKG